MKKQIFAALLAATAILTFSSCEKDDDHQHDGELGSVTLELEHVWGPTAAEFAIGKELIHPVTGDTITFNLLKYYVSNIKLQKTDGTWWVQPESYYLAGAATAEEGMLKINNVPEGEYKAIEFTIGVDSLHNVSGAQTGALSASNGMFWDWSTGYIFVRAEGKSPHSPTGNFLYHLGGFEGANNAINTITMNFGAENLRASKNAAPMIHAKVNAARFWHGGVKIKDLSVIHAMGPEAVSMAKNFATGIVFDHIHN